MAMEDMYQQLMLERMQMLEEALERAESGKATPDDWTTIRYECGISRSKANIKQGETQ
jgi:hypothetical protein